MELALARIHTDIQRLSALLDVNNRVMTSFEAMTMTGYLRCLAAISRASTGAGKKLTAGKSWDELIEMATGIPELRDALGTLGAQ